MSTTSYRRRARKRPHLQISPAYPSLGSPLDHDPGSSSSTRIDGCLQGPESPTERNDAWNKRQITIDFLPDDVLLEIFDFLAVESNLFEAENWWHTLVHVCQKWRIVIFGSPRRLNLRLICSDRTPVREMLDIWPPLPIVIHQFAVSNPDVDNIIAALKRNDRLCHITLKLDIQSWEEVMDAMQEPFPALTHMTLSSDIDVAPIVPDSFMRASAPRLQYLRFDGVQIEGFPKLFSSATDLVHLILCRIPHSRYTSPEAMVTCLSTLPRLEKLYLRFACPRSPPNRESRRLPPPTRSILPALTKFQFTGVSEYLEDLVGRIDSPVLDCLEIGLSYQLILDTPQLIQFISRTPTLKIHDQARVDFSELHVRVTFPKIPTSSYHLTLKILCRQPEWQLSSMAQICTSFSPRKVERLYIRERSYSVLEWKGSINGSQWLELLRPFTAVKKFYVSKEFVPRFAPFLHELVGGSTTEVLPALRTLCLEDHPPSGPFEEAIRKFVARRRLSNRPVVVTQKKWRNPK